MDSNAHVVMGALKMQDRKLRDQKCRKMLDKIALLENAGPEYAGVENVGPKPAVPDSVGPKRQYLNKRLKMRHKKL